MKEYEQKEKAEREIDLTEEEIEAKLKAFFAEQKEQYGDAPVPEGCVTIEEAYQESLKHLEELYAKKKSGVNA